MEYKKSRNSLKKIVTELFRNINNYIQLACISMRIHYGI